MLRALLYGGRHALRGVQELAWHRGDLGTGSLCTDACSGFLCLPRRVPRPLDALTGAFQLLVSQGGDEGVEQGV